MTTQLPPAMGDDSYNPHECPLCYTTSPNRIAHAVDCPRREPLQGAPVDLASSRYSLDDLRELAWANRTDQDVDALGTFDRIIRERNEAVANAESLNHQVEADLADIQRLAARVNELEAANQLLLDAGRQVQAEADRLAGENLQLRAVINGLGLEREESKVDLATARAAIVRLKSSSGATTGNADAETGLAESGASLGGSLIRKSLRAQMDSRTARKKTNF